MDGPEHFAEVGTHLTHCTLCLLPFELSLCILIASNWLPQLSQQEMQEVKAFQIYSDTEAYTSLQTCRLHESDVGPRLHSTIAQDCSKTS